MNQSLITLATFVVVCGLVKCIVIGTGLERHFSMISGVIVMIVVVTGIKNFNFNELSFYDHKPEMTTTYNSLVISKATEIVEENVVQAVLSRYGCDCSVEVTLDYEDEYYSITNVIMTGVKESDSIRLYLADYLSVEEDVISFA